MIRQILVALDGSEAGRAAGKYAAHLGVKMSAGVRALNVIDARALEGPTFRDFTMQMGLEPFETYTQALRDVLQKQADEVIARFKEDANEIGLLPENLCITVETGIIAPVICEQAARADLVLMGQHGAGRTFTGGLLGSIAEQIVRRATRPVMVCPPSYAPIRRLLAAYDGSEPANTALHLAADVAIQLGTDLTVLIVVDGEQMTHEQAQRVKASALDYLAHADIEVKVSVVEGYAENCLVELGERGTHDLIVMGAFGRSRVRELIVGSTTAYVMRKSMLPVLLVRP